MDGWIKIHRKVTEDELYFQEKFTRMQAWIDLIILAAYKPRTFRLRGCEVKVEVGQVAISVTELAERWKWSHTKVLRFMTKLQKSGKVILQKNNVINRISIVNYEYYQENATTSATTNNTTNDTTETAYKSAGYTTKTTIGETTNNTTNDTTNQKKKNQKENILKNIKETPTNVGGKEKAAADAATTSKVKSIEERQKDFYNLLRPYVNKYPEEMLTAFYNYWSEPNRSRTKMRAELEKTWDLPRRLATWNRKSEERKFYGTNRTSYSTAQTTFAAASAVAKLLADNE